MSGASDDALKALTARRFRPIQLPELMMFTFGHDEPFIDVVLARSEDDATAYRSRVDENDVRFDALAPGNVVWWRNGDLPAVVDELLDLPRPDEPRAPRLVVPTPSSLWVPPSTRPVNRERSFLEI
ncbi:hypothetical protein [Haloechinothrix salitolerans]|uniref:Uncharacterized protein n=1 Tax=Haloechinothrix salitolerans TaxID=926830 RepID=A0ABW2C8L9_9PSEU